VLTEVKWFITITDVRRQHPDRIESVLRRTAAVLFSDDQVLPEQIYRNEAASRLCNRSAILHSLLAVEFRHISVTDTTRLA